MKKIFLLVICCLLMGCTLDNTLENSPGELIIEDMVGVAGFAVLPKPKFTNSKYASEISYTILNTTTYVEYKDGWFYSEEVDAVTVEAKTQYHTTTFELEFVEYSDSNRNFYLNRVREREEYWMNSDYSSGGTVFIGDSFFDTEFWSNFYTSYTDGNTFANGVSSSTVLDWKLFASRLLYPLKPQNVVIHLGTNDLFDDRNSPELVVENLINF